MTSADNIFAHFICSFQTLMDTLRLVLGKKLNLKKLGHISFLMWALPTFLASIFYVGASVADTGVWIFPGRVKHPDGGDRIWLKYDIGKDQYSNADIRTAYSKLYREHYFADINEHRPGISFDSAAYLDFFNHVDYLQNWFGISAVENGIPLDNFQQSSHIFLSGKLTSEVFAHPIKYGEPAGCKLVLNTNHITEATADLIVELLNEYFDPVSCSRSTHSNGVDQKPIKFLEIVHSYGGDVGAAIKIIRSLQQYKIPTVRNDSFSGDCFSACSLIFAGAPARHYVQMVKPWDMKLPTSGAKLGMHKPAFVSQRYDSLQAEKDLDRMKYELIELLGKVGVSPDFVIKTFEKSNSEMLQPSIQQLLLWNVITHYGPPKGTNVEMIYGFIKPHRSKQLLYYPEPYLTY